MKLLFHIYKNFPTSRGTPDSYLSDQLDLLITTLVIRYGIDFLFGFNFHFTPMESGARS